MTSNNNLKITFQKSENLVFNHLDVVSTPFASSSIYSVPIDDMKLISRGDDVKRVYQLTLDTRDIGELEFMPGDCIGIVPSNCTIKVEQLIERLNRTSEGNDLCILDQSSLKRPVKHLPARSTIRHIFTHHVDINTPPKKLFLKSLQQFTTDPEELSELKSLCSPQNSQKYLDFIAETGRTLSGLLSTFKSCQPPLELILQNLPPLQPRPYSISSSPLLKNRLTITFFVSEWNDGSKGLCTGWLENIGQDKTNTVPFYFRQPTNFKLVDIQDNLILIATGTGLGVFRAFIQHKDLIGNYQVGDIWLFYGCRYSDRDFLYKEEMQDYLDRNVLTKLDVAFSREKSEIKYVQDLIEKNSIEFIDWVMNRNAKIFICGNVKTVVKDVRVTIANCLVDYGNMAVDEAEDYLKRMEVDRRYMFDTWI